ncbi:MAG: DUF4229 domain-containing protein [Candidatus Nanopelagicales bacterium]
MSDTESSPESEPQDVNSLTNDEQASATGSKHPILLYTLARTLLLAASLGVVYLLGARGILWIIIGFVISALLSYLLLGKLRDQIGAGVGNHFDKLNEQVEEGEPTLADELRPADELPSPPADELSVTDEKPDRE